MAEQRPRVALVLGAGGTLGGVFHAVTLRQIRRQTGWDPARADLIVGTSAGSIAAGLLRAGMTVDDLCARHDGTPMSRRGREIAAILPSVRPSTRETQRPAGGRPAGRFGAFAASMRDPFAVRPASVAASFMPRGTMPNDWMAEAFDTVLNRQWPTAPLWVCTVRSDTARRAVHGGTERVATPGRAIAASCAVPGMFEPMSIAGVDHFDGGTHSPTNLDVVGQWKPDVVVVVSPMSAARPSAAPDMAMRLWARSLVSAERLTLGRRVHVIIVEPHGRVLETMGGDLMAAHRRRELFDVATAMSDELLPDSIDVLTGIAGS